MKTRILKVCIAILLPLFAATIVFLAFMQNNSDNRKLSESEITALRETYPIRDEKKLPDGLFADVIYAAKKPSMDSILRGTEIIVIGKIIEDIDTYIVNFMPDLTNPRNERILLLRKSHTIVERRQYRDFKIQVLETWYGDPSIKEITGLIPPIQIYSTPFKEGMKGVFYLTRALPPHINKYWMGNKGFFYLTDTNYILSLISDEQYNKYSGMKVGAFKRAILDIKKKAGHYRW
jgi:hypothetical protein